MHILKKAGEKAAAFLGVVATTCFVVALIILFLLYEIGGALRDRFTGKKMEDMTWDLS